MRTMDSGNPSEVVFFLGAGASVAAGVPDTRTFVRDFLAHNTGRDSYLTLTRIVDRLKKFKGSANVDLELLLETLTKIERREDEVLLKFCKAGRFVLPGFDPAMVRNLKDYIIQRATVQDSDVKYLTPLRDFIDEYGTLDVISVNYDTSVEQFCEVNRLSCVDGFDLKWNPRSFSAEASDVRLYKLHGSVTWFETDRGDYIKLPVKIPEAGLETIIGERAKTLMLYPMEKWYYAEPLLELLGHVKRLLESEHCKVLVVVGYSFRDEHIRRIVLDAARRNRRLTLVVIDPSSQSVYETMLRHYGDAGRTKSHLDGRVVCLPYRFEEVIAYTREMHIAPLLKSFTLEAAARSEELKGQSADWAAVFQSYVEAEHVEKADAIAKARQYSVRVSRAGPKDIPWTYRLACSMYNRGHAERGNHYRELLTEQLARVYSDVISTLRIHLDRPDQPIEFFRMNDLEQPVRDIRASAVSRAFVGSKDSQEAQNTDELVTRVFEYVSCFPSGYLPLKSYIELRQEEIPDTLEAINRILASSSRVQESELGRIIIAAERSIFSHILGRSIPEKT